jgi:ferredoxin
MTMKTAVVHLYLILHIITLPYIEGFVRIVTPQRSTAIYRRHFLSLFAQRASDTPQVTDSLLPFDRISQEWSAKFQPKSDLTDEGIYMVAKSSKELVVDTIHVSFPRRPGAGLGIELLEIAGGREDGVGITIVSQLIEGGCAYGSEILPGDSISKVAVWQREEEIAAVATECLSYDVTVDMIRSLPSATSDQESYVLTIKRLRQKPKIKINVQYPPSQRRTDEVMELFSGENLRQAMLLQGIELTDDLAKEYFEDKGSGTCGSEGFCCQCAVSITGGAKLLNPQGTTEDQWLAENPRWRLSCKAIGVKEGEMTIRVNPQQW